MPLAEPQVPAHPVTPQAPLPPAAVDGLLRHAQLGSQFLDREKPVRAACGSRAPGSPVPDGCTLACGHVVKFAVASGGRHGSLRPLRVRRFGVTRARGRGSRAVAVGAVLVSPVPQLLWAGEQRGLACRPGPAISSAGSARDVKPMAVADSGPGRARRPRVPRALGRRGRPSTGLPLSGPDAPTCAAGARSGGRGRGRGSEPPWPGAHALRRPVVVGTMNGGENDLFSGQCPRQRGHGMRT